MTEIELEWTRWHHAVGGGSFYFETAPLGSGITVIRFVTSEGTQCDVPRGVTCWNRSECVRDEQRCFFTLGLEPYELRLFDKVFFRLVPQLYARQEPCKPTHTVQVAQFRGR